MKNILLPLSLTALTTVTSFAQADQPVSSREGFYLGVKTGDMSSDIDEIDLESPKALLLGWEFDNGFAIEYEHSEADAEYEYFWSVDVGFTTVSGTHAGEGDFETDALYGVYRTYNESGFFMKLKAGILNEDISLTVVDEDGDTVNANEDDLGFSAGIGAGYRSDRFSLEAEYTIIEGDVQFLSVGLNAHF